MVRELFGYDDLHKREWILGFGGDKAASNGASIYQVPAAPLSKSEHADIGAKIYERVPNDNDLFQADSTMLHPWQLDAMSVGLLQISVYNLQGTGQWEALEDDDG
jgi:hypothetical protein|tara:strand:- start:1750 stop:2064 length:315 start_codon:yes stop_codon:yes gene_type:complete